MKATELRIGNFITDQFGEITEVSGINDIEVHSKIMGDITLDCCLSIPLTEEWLIKLGFKKGVLENDNYKINISFYDIWRLRYQEKEGYGDADCYLENYWSVHQLQNLYFELTGEELKYSQQ